MAWYNFINNNRQAKAFVEYKAKADAELNEAYDTLNALDVTVHNLQQELDSALADGVATREEIAATPSASAESNSC